MSNILKRLRTPKKRTNINFFQREQLKKLPGKKTDMAKYPNPSYDIQLKAMQYEKLHDSRCVTAKNTNYRRGKAGDSSMMDGTGSILA